MLPRYVPAKYWVVLYPKEVNLNNLGRSNMDLAIRHANIQQSQKMVNTADK